MEQKVNAFPHSGLEVTQGGRVNVYVDGSCSYNGCANAIAGIGIWFGDNHRWNTSKTLKEARVTNIVAETLAAIEAIKIYKEKDVPKLRIITHSQYLIDCVLQYMGKWKQNGWLNAKNRPIVNQELLKVLDPYMENTDVIFQHIPGHQRFYGNEQANRLAKIGSKIQKEGKGRQQRKSNKSTPITPTN
ncbi:ribonuclease H1-like [Diachasma alloeum]|uniref:ribonuclease H1-like n=1 Tax=Diachasma alloeum TaxID=454923 RepID=UPI0007384972|nr:ribonuclease H1-like [Diachasma alloeum]